MSHGRVAFGPDTTCTLDTCNIEWSVYQYRPSLAANAAFIALFALVLFIQIGQGIRYKTWGFTIAMILGCITEIVGYAGRLILYQNPFDFNGFLMQIVCITFAPAFYSAAIYITLSQIITYLDPSLSRFSPKLFYFVFIGCDIVSLVLQAAGGGLSTNSSGSSQIGVNLALAGLCMQVIFLVIFISLVVDYAIRYVKSQHAKGIKVTADLTTKFKVFAIFLFAAIIFILIRCAYRIDELSSGYSGPLIHDEGLFIALEGVMIVVAAFCLIVAHPGPAFRREAAAKEVVSDSDSDKVEKGQF